MPMPLIAVVGRPNVGKSTLFNRIVGKRLSIVEDTPGVTRDRIYAKGEWRGKDFRIVDTGGIEPGSADGMLSAMRRQAQLAIESADVIIFVTDIKSGLTAADRDVAEMLRRSGRPVVLCVNKCDSTGYDPPEIYEFYGLGVGEPIAVSSVHGHGVADLLDECFSRVSFDDETDSQPDAVSVAITGRPNVGKSSLVNLLSGEERVIVSSKAGTTRDATDTLVETPQGRFVLIDTAGIRRHSKVEDSIERYSVLRSQMAVDRADVCVVMLDATQGIAEQDTKIAGYAHEQGKPTVLAVNKWDAIEKNDKTMSEFTKKLESEFSFMPYAPHCFISAKTGLRVDKLLSQAVYADRQAAVRIPTGRLNEMLAYATARVQPPSDKGRRLRIFYMTQVSVKPPTFVVFVNDQDLFHFSYQRYLENQIRETFGLDGTPLRMTVRQRGEKG